MRSSIRSVIVSKATTDTVTPRAASERVAPTAPATGLRMRASFSRLALAVAMCVAACPSADAQTTTQCVVGGFCYCVQSRMLEPVSRNVEQIRGLVRAERAKGKATGYMSIAISGVGGSSYTVNAAVAREVKRDVETRFGASLAWILNPAAPEISLPKGATGADYMLMWTRVLGGDDGLGRDFDFVYFVGTSAYEKFFGFDRPDRVHGAMDKIAAYYDRESQKNEELKAIPRAAFVRYYALKGSVAFSLGAHDEWNIVRAINALRRDEKNAKDFGIPGQLPVWFDGRPVPSAVFESSISPGDVGACRN